MPYGDGTMNVGVREAMGSHIDLIHGGSGEIAHLAHRRGMGEVRCKVIKILGESR